MQELLKYLNYYSGRKMKKRITQHSEYKTGNKFKNNKD